jgi:copper(I)-binding protein
MHETMAGSGEGAMGHMMPVPEVVVKAGETLRFAPGGRHVMLLQLSKKPAIGESVPVRLRFRGAGDITLAAEVVAYADVEGRLAPR